MQGYIGEIRMFAGNFAPNGWLFCNGQSLSIDEYDTLFYVVGTQFGGDGVQYFNVPNLASRVPVGMGQGAGLSNYVVGMTGGTEANTITMNSLPSHGHGITGGAGILVSTEDGRKLSPVSNYPAGNGDMIYSTTRDLTTMAPAVVNLTAASAGTPAPLPLSNVKPVLAINFIISAFGIFPQP